MRTLILILSIFLITSCSNDDDPQTPESTPINFIEIGKGALYGDGDEGIAQSNRVIDNDTDWQTLLNQMNSVSNVSNEFAETNIDFDNYIVIAVFLEVKRYGWEVEISSILENNTDITVSKTETAFESAVITQPFHIVKIPRTDKSITFE